MVLGFTIVGRVVDVMIVVVGVVVGIVVAGGFIKRGRPLSNVEPI